MIAVAEKLGQNAYLLKPGKRAHTLCGLYFLKLKLILKDGWQQTLKVRFTKAEPQFLRLLIKVHNLISLSPVVLLMLNPE